MVSGIGGPPGGGGKIGGPGAISPGAPEAPEATGAARSTLGANFGETLDRVGRAASASAPTAASPLDRLKAGEIDTKRYVELRVSEATAHLDGVLPATDLEKIRADLHDLIENDPDVAALVKTAEIGR